MSVIQPTAYPGWASGVSGAGNVTEPIASQKATGWTVNQTVPHGYLNWLDLLTYQWLAYLDPATKAIVCDDFIGRDVDYAKWLSATGCTMVDDSGAAGFGALEIGAASGANNAAGPISRTPVIGPTGDFSFSAKLRAPSGHTGGTVLVGLAGGANPIYFNAPTGTSAGWQFVIGATTVASSPTGLSVTSYQTLTIQRENSLLRANIDGINVYSASHGASLIAEGPFVTVAASTLALTKVRVDWIKFLADLNR